MLLEIYNWNGFDCFSDGVVSGSGRWWGGFLKMVGGGRLDSKICAKWEVGLVEGGISKLVRGWRLIPQTGGRWKVGPQKLVGNGRL